MGPCSAKAFAADFPDLQLAQSGYTLKDSRAVPRAPDGIGEVAAKAADGGCFDRVSTSEEIEACISGS